MATVDEAVGQRLNRADELLELLREQRDRLASERNAMALSLVGNPLGPLVGAVTEFRTRIGTADTMLASIDEFVGGVFARVEAKAKDAAAADAERVALADRLLKATNNILTTVGGTSPFNDILDNFVQAAKDVRQDVEDIAKVGGVSVALGFGIALGVWLLLQLGGRRR